jgi:hypothetical protein
LNGKRVSTLIVVSLKPLAFCSAASTSTSNLMRNATAKGSMRLKRKAAAWDDDFLASLVAE